MKVVDQGELRVIISLILIVSVIKAQVPPEKLKVATDG